MQRLRLNNNYRRRLDLFETTYLYLFNDIAGADLDIALCIHVDKIIADFVYVRRVIFDFEHHFDFISGTV